MSLISRCFTVLPNTSSNRPGPRSFGGLVKDDQQPRFVGGWQLEGYDFDVHLARFPVEFNERSFFSCRLAGFDGAIDGGAQVGYHTWPNQLQKITCGRAGHLFEIIIGAATELFDV